jgi:hypothetical protein
MVEKYNWPTQLYNTLLSTPSTTPPPEGPRLKIGYPPATAYKNTPFRRPPQTQEEVDILIRTLANASDDEKTSLCAILCEFWGRTITRADLRARMLKEVYEANVATRNRPQATRASYKKHWGKALTQEDALNMLERDRASRLKKALYKIYREVAQKAKRRLQTMAAVEKRRQQQQRWDAARARKEEMLRMAKERAEQRANRASASQLGQFNRSKKREGSPAPSLLSTVPNTPQMGPTKRRKLPWDTDTENIDPQLLEESQLVPLEAVEPDFGEEHGEKSNGAL